MRHGGPGRLLDLPVFKPDINQNSVYLYYNQTAQRERPTGYSTLAPLPAFRTARRLQALNCGGWTRLVNDLGIRHIVVHRPLYAEFRPQCLAPTERALRAHGFHEVAVGGELVLWSTP